MIWFNVVGKKRENMLHDLVMIYILDFWISCGAYNENAPSAGTERSDRRANHSSSVLRARVKSEILCCTCKVVYTHVLRPYHIHVHDYRSQTRADTAA